MDTPDKIVRPSLWTRTPSASNAPDGAHGKSGKQTFASQRRKSKPERSAAQGISTVPASEIGTSSSTGTMRSSLGRRGIFQWPFEERKNDVERALGSEGRPLSPQGTGGELMQVKLGQNDGATPAP
jgi:hypothetical protein